MPEQAMSDEEQPTEKPFPWRCPKCRQLSVVRVTMLYRCQRTHNGRVMTVEVPNFAVPCCSNCGEIVFDHAADEQIRATLRTQFGPAESTVNEGQRSDRLFSNDRLTPIFPVSDVEAASRFLRDNLGFTIQQAPVDG